MNKSLLMDMYELTMAQSLFKNGQHERKAMFNMFFRKNPYQGEYAIFCGIQDFAKFLDDFYFTMEEINYLASCGFEKDFLNYLHDTKLNLTVLAEKEGEIVFPREPLVIVQGPIVQCMLIESALLNIVNYQTLVATKARRIVHAANNKPVLEFGLRRAHGHDGALSATRAAYVGGCAATSNVLAAKNLGIRASGTMAHSWIMAHKSELDAFAAYKDTNEKCIALVDTYDAEQGVRNAMKVFKDCPKRLEGIRLDSGDLSKLGKSTRHILDGGGFTTTKIYASNDLDEYSISKLEQDNSYIDAYGVGTRLVTGDGQGAIGGVYKLISHEVDGEWQDVMKFSNESIKCTLPGFHTTARLLYGNKMAGDTIYSRAKHEYSRNVWSIMDNVAWDCGKNHIASKALDDIQSFSLNRFKKLDDSHKLLLNPAKYDVTICEDLEEKIAKNRLKHFGSES